MINESAQYKANSHRFTGCTFLPCILFVHAPFKKSIAAFKKSIPQYLLKGVRHSKVCGGMHLLFRLRIAVSLSTLTVVNTYMIPLFKPAHAPFQTHAANRLVDWWAGPYKVCISDRYPTEWNANTASEQKLPTQCGCHQRTRSLTTKPPLPTAAATLSWDMFAGDKSM